MAAATAQRTEAAAAAAAAPAPTQQEPPSSSGRGAVLETAAGIAYRQVCCVCVRVCDLSLSHRIIGSGVTHLATGADGPSMNAASGCRPSPSPPRNHAAPPRLTPYAATPNKNGNGDNNNDDNNNSTSTSATCPP